MTREPQLYEFLEVVFVLENHNAGPTRRIWEPLVHATISLSELDCCGIVALELQYAPALGWVQQVGRKYHSAVRAIFAGLGGFGSNP